MPASVAALLALRRGDHRLTLFALSLSAIAYGLLQCFAIPALPEIQRDLHASPNAVSWVLTAFLISASVATPILGRLGDMYGKERVLLATLGILSVGTLLSAVAGSMTVLLAGRALQGVSGGFFPLAFAIIRDEFPPARVAGGLGLVSSLLGIGSAAGLVLAGPIVSGLGYRWLFWIALLVVLLAAVATWALVPESPVKTLGRIDWIGGLLLSAGLVTVLLAVSRTTAWGWVSARTLGLATAGAALLAVWVAAERRHDEPLVDIRMLRTRVIWTTNVATILVGVGMYAAFILLPQYVQEPRSTGFGFGASITQAGLYILPMPLMLLVTGARAGWFDRHFGPRRSLLIAATLCSGCWAVLTVAHGSPWEIAVAAGLCGAGNGVALAALPILITRSVPPEQTGVANGMNNVMRTIGGAVGGQCAATLIAHSAVDGHASEHGYALAFGMGAIALALAFAPTLAIPRRGLPAAVAPAAA
jgi:EmrB/QacA subfamily drug resistance transporter